MDSDGNSFLGEILSHFKGCSHLQANFWNSTTFHRVVVRVLAAISEIVEELSEPPNRGTAAESLFLSRDAAT